jgi:hypothetical protein
MADLRTKALGYLRARRVCVQEASTPAGSLRPSKVRAQVQGHTGRYTVEFDGRTWTCTCEQGRCAHRCSVQMVTGWPSPADRPPQRSSRSSS